MVPHPCASFSRQGWDTRSPAPTRNSEICSSANPQKVHARVQNHYQDRREEAAARPRVEPGATRPTGPGAHRGHLKALDEAYPNAKCALNHSSPWELLVATILSAQCTDVRVNLVTPELFRRFPNPGGDGQSDAAGTGSPHPDHWVSFATRPSRFKARPARWLRSLAAKFRRRSPN